jgi:phage portal protein BeeE
MCGAVGRGGIGNPNISYRRATGTCLRPPSVTVGISPRATARYAVARLIPNSCAATSTVTTGTAHGLGSRIATQPIPRGRNVGGLGRYRTPTTAMVTTVIFGRGLAGAAGLAANLPRLQPQVQAWTTSTLDAVVWADILGGNVAPVSRPAAMAVPAVARARHLICSAIGRLPIAAYRTAEPVDPQPYWCQGTDGQIGSLTIPQQENTGIEPQSPFHRMIYTVDDHLFYGESLWAVSSVDSSGRPSRMVHVPWSGWDRVYQEKTGRYEFTDAGGGVLDFPVIYFPGPHEGILNFAQTTIRTAAAMERVAGDVASRPFRLELHQTTDIELTKAERSDLINATRAALADNNGVLFTNAAIETKTHSLDPASDLLIAGRNASALDIARDVSMPAAMLDAVQVGASLTYETTQGRNQEWLDYGLQLYLDAITSRLSMDDVLPAGQRAAFDLSTFTAPTAPATGAPTDD